MLVNGITVTCPRCRSTIELENRALCDFGGKFTFLCPVCSEGEIEYQPEPAEGARSLQREALLAR